MRWKKHKKIVGMIYKGGGERKSGKAGREGEEKERERMRKKEGKEVTSHLNRHLKEIKNTQRSFETQ